MNETEVALLKDALVLLDDGLSNLIAIETNHPTLTAILEKVVTAIHLTEKLIAAYEKL